MKLLISIEYRTRWGEQLVMRIGKRRIALQYADGGVWTGAIERYPALIGLYFQLL